MRNGRPAGGAPGAIHVIGAGLAGLSAALALARRGHGPRLTLWEASPHAGGRCRSYDDPVLGCVLDNGNHLVMSGNGAALDHVARLHGGDWQRGLAESPGGYGFVDVASGARWQLRPSRGRVPWWLLDPQRRLPGTRLRDYASLLRVLAAPADATMAALVDAGHPLHRSFWEPLTLAALNTAPEQAAAALMQPVLWQTFGRGWDAARPLMARDTLGDTFITPALGELEAAGVQLRFGARVRALDIAGRRIAGLRLGEGPAALAHDDLVVLAVPAWIAPELVPGLRAPPAGEPIVNVHYRLPAPAAPHRIIGLIGGIGQWLFVRGALASVTISAAREPAQWDADRIAGACWPEVAIALGLPVAPMPPVRVVKERRATFAQTPADLPLRSGARGPLDNLVLAGDWTDTGLPATIEGALRSGLAAARLAGDKLDGRA